MSAAPPGLSWGPPSSILGSLLVSVFSFPRILDSLLESRPSLPTLTEPSPSLRLPPPPPEHHTHRQLLEVTEQVPVLAQLSVFRSPSTGNFSTCLQLQSPGFSPPFSAPPVLFPVCFLGPWRPYRPSYTEAEGREEHRGCSVLFVEYMNESVKDVGIEGAQTPGQPDLGTDSMLSLINLLS